jgi:hypothetical protein
VARDRKNHSYAIRRVSTYSPAGRSRLAPCRCCGDRRRRALAPPRRPPSRQRFVGHEHWHSFHPPRARTEDLEVMDLVSRRWRVRAPIARARCSGLWGS